MPNYIDLAISHRRHDISDELWDLLSDHLPGGKGKVGRRAADNRTFVNAVFWILRTGAPWRDVPPDYGDWKIPIGVSAAGKTGVYGKIFLIW